MVRLGGADRAVHAEGKRGRPPFPVESLLRIHFMQQWFTLSDPAMEEALHDMPLFRDFAGLGGWDDRLPDESTICDSAMCWRSTRASAERILATVNLLLGCQGPDAAQRHSGRCHADLRTELDQERQR